MALVLNHYGQQRLISADAGELNGPMQLTRVETITAETTTNLFKTYLTSDGLVGGRKLFSKKPSVAVQLADAAAGANAAVTDGFYVTILAYAEATGLLSWMVTKIVTTTVTIVAVGDGAFEFHLQAIGPAN